MESYAGNEPRIGIVRTAMGACAQIAVFTLFARHGRALTGVSPEHAQIVGSV